MTPATRACSAKSVCRRGYQPKANHSWLRGEERLMILYNTIVGLAAGVGLLLVSQLLKQFANAGPIQPEGFALAFGITGFIQTVLGLTISMVWPYNKVLYTNIIMGEPALFPPRSRSVGSAHRTKLLRRW